MVRIRREDRPPKRPASPELSAGRGEWASFQIVVRGPAKNVRVEVQLPGIPVELYRQHFVEVKEGTAPWDWDTTTQPRTAHPEPPGWIPDALIPLIDPVTGKPPMPGARFSAQPFDVPAGENQPIWVDVFVPRDTKPGVRRGSWRVTSDTQSVKGTFRLKVRNFTVPLGPSLHSAMNVWNYKSRETNELLLRHRLMPRQVPAEEVPEWRSKYGLERTNLGYWSGANYSQAKMAPAPSLDDVLSRRRRYPNDFGLYNFSVDEIGHHKQLFPEVRRWGDVFHAANVKHMAVMEPLPELFDAIDIWVLQPNYFFKSVKNVEAARAAGAELWSYTALNQDPYAPKWLLDYAPIHHRMFHGLMSQVYGFTGVLYWSVDYNKWGINLDEAQVKSDGIRDVWTDPNWRGDGKKNFPGEGLLIYPGADCGCQGCVPSLRLKWIRDGVQDYELVQMLKKRGKEKEAMALVKKVARSYKDWSQSPDALLDVRNALCDLLERT